MKRRPSTSGLSAFRDSSAQSRVRSGHGHSSSESLDFQWSNQNAGGQNAGLGEGARTAAVHQDSDSPADSDSEAPSQAPSQANIGSGRALSVDGSSAFLWMGVMR
jgi:hypothetical protein